MAVVLLAGSTLWRSLELSAVGWLIGVARSLPADGHADPILSRSQAEFPTVLSVGIGASSVLLLALFLLACSLLILITELPLRRVLLGTAAGALALFGAHITRLTAQFVLAADNHFKVSPLWAQVDALCALAELGAAAAVLWLTIHLDGPYRSRGRRGGRRYQRRSGPGRLSL